MQSWYTDPAVSDVCAQFNKTFIFKARLCLLLIFSSSVLGCSLWDVQQHSSYYSICASKPAQNNKNVQVCLFAALVWVKLNRYMAVLSVVQFRSSSGIKKNMETTFLELFAGAGCTVLLGKSKSLQCLYISIISGRQVDGSV